MNCGQFVFFFLHNPSYKKWIMALLLQLSEETKMRVDVVWRVRRLLQRQNMERQTSDFPEAA